MIPSPLADILWYAVPALALVTLVLGIRWRGKSPVWLPLVAALAPLGTIALMLGTASIDPAGWEPHRLRARRRSVGHAKAHCADQQKFYLCDSPTRTPEVRESREICGTLAERRRHGAGAPLPAVGCC